MRYTAPPHTVDAHLSTGRVEVDKKGFLDVPGISDTDHAGLVRSGFTPVAGVTPVADTKPADAKV